jgi:acyl-CoA thioesterase
MGFSDLIEQLRQSPARQVTLPATWNQGRAVFGGLIAGLLYEGMRLEVEAERLVRSFSISFVGPVAADVPLRVEARVLRQGRAVTQVQAHALQGDEVMAVALASFGAGRESRLRVPPVPAPEVKTPGNCETTPFVPGISPSFAQHFDTRWAIGSYPYTGVDHRAMGGWMRFREPQSEISEAHLLGLIDAWPPAILPLLTEQAPISTLTWSLDFIHPLPAMQADDWLLYRAVIDHVRDGYNQSHAHVWTRDGDLIALSRQTVTVFG